MLKAALIGFGKWGKNYYRILNHLNYQKVLNFCFISRSNYKKKILDKKNLTLKTISYKNIFKKKIDILFVSSPPKTHLFFSKQAIKYKIPVLIEKPLTLDFESTNKIKNLLNKKKLIFLVNHQHIMSPYFKMLKKLVNNKNIKKIYSEAHGIGPKRDYSILWDWIPHDLSMIFDLLGINKKITILNLKKQQKYKGYERWNIKFIIDDIYLNINIGNNFKKKTRIFSVFEKNGNVITLNDQNSSRYKLRHNNKYIKIKNTFPLENKIQCLINLANKKKYHKLHESEYMKDINLSLKIAKSIEKIYYYK